MLLRAVDEAGSPVSDEPVVTGSVTEPSPTTPVSMLDRKTSDS
jgi:hypothetical protein